MFDRSGRGSWTPFPKFVYNTGTGICMLAKTLHGSHHFSSLHFTPIKHLVRKIIAHPLTEAYLDVFTSSSSSSSHQTHNAIVKILLRFCYHPRSVFSFSSPNSPQSILNHCKKIPVLSFNVFFYFFIFLCIHVSRSSSMNPVVRIVQ